MSRDELIVLVREQVERIVAHDGQITALATRIAGLVEANEDLTRRLARVEHLLSRNSQNSCSPPSKDDEPGKRAPRGRKRRGRGQPKREPGTQSRAPGFHLAWTQTPDERTNRFPHGRCECGHDLAAATDLGVVDRCQQHEIPQVTVRVTQYDQRAVRCGCGRVRTTSGTVGYGPNLQALVVYLMVVHCIPAHRCVALLQSLTGAARSVGFVHGLLARAAGLLTAVHQRIRTLITMAYAVSCDETPLRVGPRTPKPGKKKAEKYLLVACPQVYTHYLLGDRSLDTFKASVVKHLTDSVIVHDRYQNYDAAELGTLTHQLCCAHLLRDLDDAADVYPDAAWPTQIADAPRALTHQANLARRHGRTTIPATIINPLYRLFHQGVLVGISATTSPRHPPRRADGPAAGSPARPRNRHPPLRPGPESPAHLQPGRTRSTTRQDPTEHLRPTHQRKTHPRPLQHPRLPIDRRQTRPQHDDRDAPGDHRPTLDATPPPPDHSGPTKYRRARARPLITPCHWHAPPRAEAECLR